MSFQIPHQEFTLEAVIAKAESATGLSNWGDSNMHQNLAVALNSFLSDVPQTDRSRAAFLGYLQGLCQNRLKIEQFFDQHPEILEVPVERPLIVSGYSRTGTTILQNLLSLDPEARPLLYWESVNPLPPPQPVTFQSDPRIEASEKALTAFYEKCPTFAKIHRVYATSPNECENLLTYDIATCFFNLIHPMPTYMEYLYSSDMKPTYRYYKRMLQLLNWKFPNRRWILKSPLHLPFLAHLTEVFPDAALVITHRKMPKVIASLCNLVATSREFNMPGSVDKYAIGQEHLSTLPKFMENYATLRAKLGDRVFYDVDYRDTVSDSLGLIRKIYMHFNIHFTEEFGQLIEDYMNTHKQHEHGKHEYHLSDYGLEEEEVNQSFQAYMNAFPKIFQRKDETSSKS